MPLRHQHIPTCTVLHDLVPSNNSHSLYTHGCPENYPPVYLSTVHIPVLIDKQSGPSGLGSARGRSSRYLQHTHLASAAFLVKPILPVVVLLSRLLTPPHSALLATGSFSGTLRALHTPVRSGVADACLQALPACHSRHAQYQWKIPWCYSKPLHKGHPWCARVRRMIVFRSNARSSEKDWTPVSS